MSTVGTLRSLLQKNEVIEVIGPTASGKKRLVMEFIKESMMTPVLFAGSSDTDEGDLLGRYVIKEGQMVFEEGTFATCLKQAGKVVVLEEYDLIDKKMFKDSVLSHIAISRGPTILIRTDIEAEDITIQPFDFKWDE